MIAQAKECTCLLQGMTNLHERPTTGEMHEGKEDAHAGVDIVWQPLLLQLAVGLEVLRSLALAGQRPDVPRRVDGVDSADLLVDAA